MENIIHDAVIIDNNYYSIGFPKEKWSDIITRDHYISQIECYLETDNNIVFIEGEEDSGKTTLNGIFARKNSNKTISIFFNPNNLLDYKIEYLFINVVPQIKHILNEFIDDTISYEFDQYRTSIYQLRKKTKSSNNYFYFIIDGLESILKERPDFINSFFENAPIGESIFKFIISGNQSDFKDICPKLKKQNSRSITLSGFSFEEITKFLNSHITSVNNPELFKVTNGLPGRLKTLKRLLENEDYSLSNIDKTTSYKNWIELDCETVDINVPQTNGIMSLISLNERLFSINEISEIFSISIEEANDIISKIRVLEISGSNVCFVSNSHKKYFSTYLRGNKKTIENLLIKHFIKEETINSKYELSKLYLERNDWAKVIEIVDDSYIESVLEGTGTLDKVNKSLEYGMKASQSLNKYVKMWCYSIQGSIINELDNYIFWESEIEARISIEDYSGAINLANSAVLKVDRLRLLALIARRQKEFQSIVDEDLINLITDLYKTTDLSIIGDKIYDIVADLIYAIPNLAIEMIEKSSGCTSEKNINDWVIAKLSLAAINSSIKEEGNSDNTKKIEAVQNINNPSVRKINRAISFLVGNYSSLKVIDEVKKLSDSKEKLILLRLWLNNNKSINNDFEIVIDLALDELIASSSTSTITLDILKDLSFQLPFVKDIQRKKDLLKRFKEIEVDLQDPGLSKDKYIYKINIFHTIFTLDTDESITCINKILVEIEAINDTLIQLESYSEVYSKLSSLKNPIFLDKINFVYSRIMKLSDQLFKFTANHYRISKNFIETLSKKNPILSLKICSSINTIFRREKSRLLILDSYLDNNLKNVNISFLENIINTFEIIHTKEEALLRILERYSEARSLHFNIIKSLLKFINNIDNIKDLNKMLSGNILSYKIITKNDEWKAKLASKLESKIFNTWQKIEADWERVDKGFLICSELSKVNNDLARKIYDESIKIKEHSWVDSNSVAYTFLNSIKLIIRSFNGILVSSKDVNNEFEIIKNLISKVPSDIAKLNLWTEIGINSYMFEHIELSKKIYNYHVIHLLDQLMTKKLEIEPVLNSIVLVHLFNTDLANHYLKQVSNETRDKAFSIICDFYVSKLNPFEIYDRDEIYRYNCSYDDILKAVKIVSLIDTDNLIYNQINNIANAVTNNKQTISKIQITKIVSDLKTIVNTKLPDKNNITHQGYKIISNLKLLILNKDRIDWDLFIKDAENIPNLSDKIFVLSIILNNLLIVNDSNIELKKKLFDEIISKLESLSVHYEFVQRVIDLTEIMYKIDRSKWKEFINRAFTISNNLEEGAEKYVSKKNLIDSMYRLDPSFAKEIIKSIDKENEGNHINELVKEYYDALEISNKIKNNKNLEEKEKENYKNIIYGVYKALAALNSEKITTKKINEISSYLPIGNKLPLQDVFPIYMYYLNNCAKTYRENFSGSMSTLHKDNFSEAIKASELVHLLSQKRKLRSKKIQDFNIEEEFSNKPIKPNNREEAFDFIRNWMFDELKEFVYIVDPYLVKEDLEILKIVLEVNRDISIHLLGSKDGYNTNTEDEFKMHWKKICDEAPPFVKITFYWNSEDGKNSPFHDRWIITKNSGLRLGTSINSLGQKKESEISVMKPIEAAQICNEIVLDYVNQSKRDINRQRLSFKSFSLT